LIVERED